MAPPGRTLLAAAIVAVVAFVGAGMAQQDEAIEERFTTCWPCHVDWPDPLRTFYEIVPSPGTGHEVGDTFDFPVRIQNPWLHDITYLEPSLDISGAPSLKFFDGREPGGDVEQGTIPVDATSPNQPQRGHVVIVVPTGATELSIVLTPTDPFVDHDVAMRIFPGVEEPTGEPLATVDEGGAGEAERFRTGDDPDTSLGQLPAGNWSIQAETLILDPGAGGVTPPTGSIPFEVRYSYSFNASAETVQYLSQNVKISSGQSGLVVWRLQSLGAPAADEVVRVTVNATVYWEHLPSSAADDEAFVTKHMDLPVSLDGQGSLVFFDGEGPAIVAAAPQGGVTVATISEAIGYASAFLLIGAVWTGGIFGRASRRQLNNWFGSAKRRVAFHNVLSYGLTLAAVVHTVLFVLDTIEPEYRWTRGIIWGGIGLLAMLLLGVTGAFQVPIIRTWNYAAWRWTHLILAIASLVFTVVHMLLDGAHFGAIQETVGWTDPLDVRTV